MSWSMTGNMRQRNEEGNETVSRVILWAHETFSTKYKCKQEGCEFHTVAFSNIVCLNCGYCG